MAQSMPDNQSMSASKNRNPDVPRNLKPYFLCLLKKGPQWNITEGNEGLMTNYLAYLRRETEARRIIFAGPITDDGEMIATAIIEAANGDGAMAVANSNPGVASGHFVAELHPCFLPALDALQVYY
ncbi:MAG TPA: YciI family protein [Alloacidobacterium sp.]|nr:YciI family protein [Alloacidobacterium sp.]